MSWRSGYNMSLIASWVLKFCKQSNTFLWRILRQLMKKHKKTIVLIYRTWGLRSKLMLLLGRQKFESTSVFRLIALHKCQAVAYIQVLSKFLAFIAALMLIVDPMFCISKLSSFHVPSFGCLGFFFMRVLHSIGI